MNITAPRGKAIDLIEHKSRLNEANIKERESAETTYAKSWRGRIEKVARFGVDGFDDKIEEHNPDSSVGRKVTLDVSEDEAYYVGFYKDLSSQVRRITIFKSTWNEFTEEWEEVSEILVEVPEESARRPLEFNPDLSADWDMRLTEVEKIIFEAEQVLGIELDEYPTISEAS